MTQLRNQRWTSPNNAKFTPTERETHPARTIAAACLLTLAIASTGCSTEPGPPWDDSCQNDVAICVAEYDELAAFGQAQKNIFLPKETGEFFAGNDVVWSKIASSSVLSRTTISSAQSETFEFPDADFIQARDDVIATLTGADGPLTYELFHSSSPDEPFQTLGLPPSPPGESFFAFGLGEDTLYIFDTTDGVLHQVDDEGSRIVLSLADLDVQLTVIQDFEVQGRQLVLSNLGALVYFDLDTNLVTSLGNENAANLPLELSITPTQITYVAGDEFFEYAIGTKTTRNLSAEILASEYQLNQAYPLAHHPLSGSPQFSRHQSTLAYEANSGIFTYDTAANRVEPLLLEPRDELIRFSYRDPSFSATGQLFVRELQSTSGSVGADGPIVQLAP